MTHNLLLRSCPNYSVALSLSFLFITTSNCLSRKEHFFFNLGGRDIILVVGACQNNSQYPRWHLSVSSFSRNVLSTILVGGFSFLVLCLQFYVGLSSLISGDNFVSPVLVGTFSPLVLGDSFLSTVLRELFSLHFLVELFYFQILGNYFLLPIFRVKSSISILYHTQKKFKINLSSYFGQIWKYDTFLKCCSTFNTRNSQQVSVRCINNKTIFVCSHHFPCLYYFLSYPSIRLVSFPYWHILHAFHNSTWLFGFHWRLATQTRQRISSFYICRQMLGGRICQRLFGKCFMSSTWEEKFLFSIAGGNFRLHF